MAETERSEDMIYIAEALFKQYRLLPPAQFPGFGHVSTLHRQLDCYGATVARLQRRA